MAISQNTWPFPALYFIELAALALACALTYGLSSSLRSMITWATVGVLAAFSILGAWTVGLYYMPVAALFLTLAVIADLRHNGKFLPHSGVAALAAVAQAAAMLLVARLF